MLMSSSFLQAFLDSVQQLQQEVSRTVPHCNPNLENLISSRPHFDFDFRFISPPAIIYPNLHALLICYRHLDRLSACLHSISLPT